MAVENPSVLYLEQSLSPEQKTVVCENIGAVRTIAGKGLSTEDFTTAEKNKLSDVESGAEANVIEEITINGTAVTPVNKSVEITIPNDVFQATYGVTTYNEIAAAVNAGVWITCLKDDRLATFSYVGTNNYEFNYHRSRAGNVDEVIVYKVDDHDTWTSATRTLVPKFNGTVDGLVPANGASATKYLKGDGTWDTPTDTTYSVFSTSADGLVPASDGTGETDKFLKGDGTWDTPTDTTYSGGNGIDITGTVVSVDIASSGSGLEFSSGLKVKTDGSTIQTNASGALEVIGGGGTTYTAGDGIDISAQDVISVKTDGTTIHANASGELEVIGGGGGTTYTAGDGIDITSGTISADIDTDAGLTIDSSSKKIQVNAGTNIGFNSSTGALDVPTVVASVSGVGGTDGVMLAADKEKLDSAVTYTDNTITGEDDMLAQQMVVVTSDNDILSFVQGGYCHGLGTIFFRVTGR